MKDAQNVDLSMVTEVIARQECKFCLKHDSTLYNETCMSCSMAMNPQYLLIGSEAHKLLM